MIARLARRYLAPRWPAVASRCCAAAFAAFSGLLLRVLQPAVNDLIVHPKPGALAHPAADIVALALGRGVAQVVQAILVNRIGNGIVGDIQLRAVRQAGARRPGPAARRALRRLRLLGALRRRPDPRGGHHRRRQLHPASPDVIAAAGVVMARPTGGWRWSCWSPRRSPRCVMRRFSKRTSKAAQGAMAETSALSTADHGEPGRGPGGQDREPRGLRGGAASPR